MDIALALAPRQKPSTPFVSNTFFAVSATVEPAGMMVCIRVLIKSRGLVATAAIDPDMAPDIRDVAIEGPTSVHRSSARDLVAGGRVVEDAGEEGEEEEEDEDVEVESAARERRDAAVVAGRRCCSCGLPSARCTAALTGACTRLKVLQTTALVGL